MLAKRLLILPLAIISIFISGCKSEHAFSSKEDEVVLVRIEVQAREPIGVNTLSAAPLALKIFNEQTVMAIGHYSDGSSRDLTEEVSWQMLDTDIATITTASLVQAGIVGETQLIATHNVSGLKSDDYPVIIEGNSRVCGNIPGKVLSTESGGGINDTGDNAEGNCMKIVEIIDPDDGYRKWITNSPSQAVLDAYGYTQDNSASNTGRTYSVLGASLKPGVQIARFNQTGLGVVLPGAGDDANAGVNGQYDRWCQELNTEAFGTKRSWRRATQAELGNLARYNNPNNDTMFDRFGWLDSGISWTSTIGTLGFSSNRYFYVNLSIQPFQPINDNSYTSEAGGESMANCVFVFQ